MQHRASTNIRQDNHRLPEYNQGRLPEGFGTEGMHYDEPFSSKAASDYFGITHQVLMKGSTANHMFRFRGSKIQAIAEHNYVTNTIKSMVYLMYYLHVASIVLKLLLYVLNLQPDSFYGSC